MSAPRPSGGRASLHRDSLMDQPTLRAGVMPSGRTSGGGTPLSSSSSRGDELGPPSRSSAGSSMASPTRLAAAAAAAALAANSVALSVASMSPVEAQLPVSPRRTATSHVMHAQDGHLNKAISSNSLVDAYMNLPTGNSTVASATLAAAVDSSALATAQTLTTAQTVSPRRPSSSGENLYSTPTIEIRSDKVRGGAVVAGGSAPLRTLAPGPSRPSSAQSNALASSAPSPQVPAKPDALRGSGSALNSQGAALRLKVPPSQTPAAAVARPTPNLNRSLPPTPKSAPQQTDPEEPAIEEHALETLLNSAQTGSSLARQRQPDKNRASLASELETAVSDALAHTSKLATLTEAGVLAWQTAMLGAWAAVEQKTALLVDRYAALPMSGNNIVMLLEPLAKSDGSSASPGTGRRFFSLHRLRDELARFFKVLARLCRVYTELARTMRVATGPLDRVAERLYELHEQLSLELTHGEADSIRQYRLETQLRQLFEQVVVGGRQLGTALGVALQRAAAAFSAAQLATLARENFIVERDGNGPVQSAYSADSPFEAIGSAFRRLFYDHEHYNYTLSAERSDRALLSVVFSRPDSTEAPLRCSLLLRAKAPGCGCKLVTTDTSSLVDLSNMTNNTLRQVFSKAFPELGTIGKIRRVADAMLDQRLLKLDELALVSRFKFGVLYCAPGQTLEEEMYANETGSPLFDQFLTSVLGQRSPLLGFSGYAAGLDTRDGLTGSEVVHTTWNDRSITYHVSTLLPFCATDTQQIQRKRHIGNDIVAIVVATGSCDVDRLSFRSHFLHVLVIVQLYENVFAPEAGGTGRPLLYRVSVVRNSDVPDFGPPLPDPPTFSSAEALRAWLIPKVIQAEFAAYQASQFAKPQTRTRHCLIDDIVQDVTAAPRSQSVSNGFSVEASGAGESGDDDSGGRKHRKALSSRVGFMSKRTQAQAALASSDDGDKIFPGYPLQLRHGAEAMAGSEGGASAQSPSSADSSAEAPGVSPTAGALALAAVVAGAIPVGAPSGANHGFLQKLLMPNRHKGAAASAPAKPKGPEITSAAGDLVTSANVQLLPQLPLPSWETRFSKDFAANGLGSPSGSPTPPKRTSPHTKAASSASPPGAAVAASHAKSPSSSAGFPTRGHHLQPYIKQSDRAALSASLASSAAAAQSLIASRRAAPSGDSGDSPGDGSIGGSPSSKQAPSSYVASINNGLVQVHASSTGSDSASGSSHAGGYGKLAKSLSTPSSLAEFSK